VHHEQRVHHRHRKLLAGCKEVDGAEPPDRLAPELVDDELLPGRADVDAAQLVVEAAGEEGGALERQPLAVRPDAGIGVEVGHLEELVRQKLKALNRGVVLSRAQAQKASRMTVYEPVDQPFVVFDKLQIRSIVRDLQQFKALGCNQG
jgi:hypothetical protein